jgi:hypothetical protein
MTIELTNYSNASNARRAAKAVGLSEFDVYKGADGYEIRAAALKAAKRWWGILGVPQTATKEDILAAYRKLAVTRHPDKGGDTATMGDNERAEPRTRCWFEGGAKILLQRPGFFGHEALLEDFAALQRIYGGGFDAVAATMSAHGWSHPRTVRAVWAMTGRPLKLII